MNYSFTDFEKDIADLYPTTSEFVRDQVRFLLDTFEVSSDRKKHTSDPTLVCYADSIIDTKKGCSPLRALRDFFVKEELASVLPVVHLLPFFPWDTDRGFSVKDYYDVDPDNGRWGDVEELGESAALMFDFVANHASIDNPMVQSALIERHITPQHPRYEFAKRYKDFVITYDALSRPGDKQLALLARPRAFPVLTKYLVYEDEEGQLLAKLGGKLPYNCKELGTGYVWTTFSRGEDESGEEMTRQVDLNFRNPHVFLEVCKILLFYIDKGASLIRLDAIGYIWKHIGSHSLHEREAHTIIRALSFFLREACPNALSIAEVNEPQEKAFTYLGTRDQPECDMVYQFTHFPLAIHALHTRCGTHYTEWLKSLRPVEGRQFTTLLGSHDGLGMKPLRGILPEDELDAFVNVLVQEHGGLPNYAKLPGGKEIVYEVCSTPWELINNLNLDEPFSLRLARYLAVIRLGFLVRGIPAIYITGLLGARKYLPQEGLDENRTVNRERYQAAELHQALADEDGEQGQIYRAVREALYFRSLQPAFFNRKDAAEPLESRDERVLFCHVPAPLASDGLYLVQNLSDEKVSFEDAIGKVSQLAGIPQDLEPYQGFWFNAVQVFD